MTRHLVVQFVRFGPYHFTRLRSAEAALETLGWKVTGLQTAGTEATYAWDQTGLESGSLATVFPDRVYEKIPAGDLRSGMMSKLDKLKPDAVAIAGWGSADARAALDWCQRHGAEAIVMSETRASDGNRRWWKEWLKARLVRRFDGALVGGKAHRDYLVSLGMPTERIETGYDIVDNEHFATKVAEARAKGLRGEGTKGQTDGGTKGQSEVGGQRSEVERTAEPYFLASSRFIERKNLRRLIDAYAEYRRHFLNSSLACLRAISPSLGSRHPSLSPWDLVLLGTGDGKEELERYVKERGLDGVVFPGFQQIDTLPRWYAGAGAFVHPALEEPWGLVINEAMACGLPVICSRTTGAAELVEDGVNGFLFDARDTASLSLLLRKMAELPPKERAHMGALSGRLVNERAPTSAFGSGLKALLQLP